MKISAEIQRLGTCAALLVIAGTSWAQCNTDGSLTGAASVIDLQGQGTFSCADISGDTSSCLNVDCTMEPAPGFSVNNITTDGVVWSADVQVDKLFVGQSGSGSRCLYDFEPGQTSGEYLLPTDYKDIVACYDGVEEVITEVEEPISTTTNCADALPGLQTSLTGDGNIITFIGIGTDAGLNEQGEADGDYVLAVCSAVGQSQCVDQCKEPTSRSYDPCGELADGEVCLDQRPCATSEEVPTGNPAAPKYCWEFSHQVDTDLGIFVPPKEKESGVAYWEQYSGSTCVKVTTSYRGRTYSYWTPSGCP